MATDARRENENLPHHSQRNALRKQKSGGRDSAVLGEVFPALGPHADPSWLLLPFIHA